MCSRYILTIPAIVGIVLGALPLAARADLSGPARVIDGDTLEVAGVTVRLLGIDAPEMAQTCPTPRGDWPCGAWARDVLAAQIGAGAQVVCREHGTDRYGRVVAQCDAGAGDLGAALVEAGAATAYRRYSTAYVAHERRARAARRGIWHDGAGQVTDPSEYRAAHRRASAPDQPAPGACAIKGNISANGRIFHMPGQRDYARTRIDTNAGERWFCTPEEALAAGWRPARR